MLVILEELSRGDEAIDDAVCGSARCRDTGDQHVHVVDCKLLEPAADELSLLNFRKERLDELVDATVDSDTPSREEVFLQGRRLKGDSM